MSAGQETKSLLSSIEAHKNELWSELYGWLTAKHHSVEEYCLVSSSLADAAEFSLAQLVLSQALSQHPDDEELALFVLGLLDSRLPKAA
jgi:hypothetical protein